MRKVISKSILLIAFMFLSMGAFAQQLGTTVFFEKEQNIVTVSVTWYLEDGTPIQGVPVTQSPIVEGGTVFSVFPGTHDEAARVKRTFINLVFNNGQSGIGGWFSGFPAIVHFGDDFNPKYWWLLVPNTGSAVRGGTPTYTITQTTVEP